MEKNKIYLEDNLDTLSKTPDNYYDLVVTSPPYDGIRKYNGFAFDIDKLTTELYRTMKPGGVVVWVVADATIKGSLIATAFNLLPTGLIVAWNNASTIPSSTIK